MVQYLHFRILEFPLIRLNTTYLLLFDVFVMCFWMLETRDQTGVKLVGFFTYSKVVAGDGNHGIL